MPLVFHLSDVHVLQSLRDGDRPTGQRLYDAIEPVLRVHTILQAHFHEPRTRAELLHVMREIGRRARETSRWPLLHLETHGSPDGLQVSSHELVTWNELYPALVNINTSTNMNFVVVVVACDGVSALKAFNYAERAPAGLLIGPSRPVYEREVEVGTAALYRTLFERHHLGDGLAAMNAAVNALPPHQRGDETPFQGHDAETLFRWAMEGYAHEFEAGPALEARIARLTRRVIARDPAALAGRAATIEADMRAHLTDHRFHFDRLRRRFFLLDLYPKNDARFTVRFEDCFRGGVAT